MTQQRTELIIQFIGMLIAALVPIVYMLYPQNIEEVDIIVKAVQGIVAAVGILVIGWAGVSFQRTRSAERTAVLSMLNYWPRHEDGEVKDGEVVGMVTGFEFSE